MLSKWVTARTSAAARAYPIGSILPPTGIAGAVLLSVMTMSYFAPSRSRHWPPTSGVLAMFFCANGGSSLPFHAMWPTMVSSLVAAIAAIDGLRDRSCRRSA